MMTMQMISSTGRTVTYDMDGESIVRDDGDSYTRPNGVLMQKGDKSYFAWAGSPFFSRLALPDEAFVSNPLPPVDIGTGIVWIIGCRPNGHTEWYILFENFVDAKTFLLNNGFDEEIDASMLGSMDGYYEVSVEQRDGLVTEVCFYYVLSRTPSEPTAAEPSTVYVTIEAL